METSVKTTSTSPENLSPKASDRPTPASSTLTTRFTCPLCSAECSADLSASWLMSPRTYRRSIISRLRELLQHDLYALATHVRPSMLSEAPIVPRWIHCEACGTSGLIFLFRQPSDVPK